MPHTQPATITRPQVAAAFALWEATYRDDPSKFLTDEEKSACAIADYGQECAIYFMALLRQVEPSTDDQQGGAA